jgi:molecular chaperone GrpE
MRRRKKLAKTQLEEKIADLENKWKRALADYQNLEKRVKKEKENFAKFSNASLIDKLLSVLDAFEKCVEHLEDKGLNLVLEQFKAVLESEGLEEIKTEREKFDPEKMDAAEIVDGPKNKVVEVVLKGYLLNGKVLRPAKVKVGGDHR